MNTPFFTGILLLGGQGTRFDSSLPKQFHWLAGKKLYQHTLEKFLALAPFREIILATSAEWLAKMEQEIAVYGDTRVKVIVGGSTRQASSFLALQACDPLTEYVVIHDGVRPFVSSDILIQNMELAVRYGAIDTCIPSTDTIVHARLPEQITAIPSRSEYWRGQTPQSFAYPLILKAHRQALQRGIDNASDDCSLVLAIDHPVHIAIGSEKNIKITTELDLFLAEQLLRSHSPSLTQLPRSDLKGKKIAVMGGSGGIGAAITHQLSQAGAIPIPISRHSAPYAADCTSASQIRALFQQIKKDHGLLDGLINAFGFLQIKDIADLSSKEIHRLIASNYTGIIYCCKWAPLQPSSHIINIASSSYTRGKKGYAIYSSAKAAVVNLTQGLAEERPDLYINAIVPQRTNTPLRYQNFPNEDRSELLDPQVVASAVIDLLQKKHITGSTIEIRRTS